MAIVQGAVSPPWMGLVLAGGQSSRMGRDKAALPWGGGTLLSHARERLFAAGAGRVFTLGRSEGEDALGDVLPGQGPLSALAQAADALPDGIYVITPVDMPLLSLALLRRLAESAGNCAHFQGHRLPMRLQLDAPLRTVLHQLDSGPAAARSLRALHEQVGAHALEAGHYEGQLRGCNTPEEWRDLIALAESTKLNAPELH